MGRAKTPHETTIVMHVDEPGDTAPRVGSSVKVGRRTYQVASLEVRAVLRPVHRERPLRLEAHTKQPRSREDAG